MENELMDCIDNNQIKSYDIKMSKHLKVKNSKFKIDVLFEWDGHTYRMYTGDLIYGPHLEIVFSNKEQCLVIKDYNRIKTQYLKKHGRSARDIDNVIRRIVKLL